MPTSDKHPARIIIGPGYIRLSFVVGIVENNTIVGHESQIISVLCDLFLRKRGTISCVVTGFHQITRMFNFVVK